MKRYILLVAIFLILGFSHSASAINGEEADLIFPLANSTYIDLNTTAGLFNLSSYSGFTNTPSQKLFSVYQGNIGDFSHGIALNGNTNVSWSDSCGWPSCPNYFNLFVSVPRGSPTGNYWEILQDSNGGNIYSSYYFVNDTNTGTFSPPPPPAPVDGIVSQISPVPGSAAGSNLINFTGTFANSGIYSTFWTYLTSNNASLAPYSWKLPLLSTPNYPFNFNYSLGGGQAFTYTMQLCNDDSSLCTPKTSPISFTVGVDPQAPSGYVEKPCTSIITEFGNCASNFIYSVFVPTPESLSQFTSLKLTEHFPFSYLIDMKNLFNDLFNQGEKTFSIGIDFLGTHVDMFSTARLKAISFQPLVRTIMGALLMLMTVTVVYKRLMRIYDTSNTTIK